jgi:oxygen-independent coproporphyrinogen-3 oxidase
MGLGASAISSIGNIYSQNFTALDEYRTAVEAGRLPVARGLTLEGDDQIRRDVIMEVMCAGGISFSEFEKKTGKNFKEYFKDSLPLLEGMQSDGLVLVDPNGFQATTLGMVLLRNVASAFDGSPAAVRGSFSI